MFRGVYSLTIDAKGRLKIPKYHQAQINKINKGNMVLSVHPDDPCLLLYPLQEWQILEKKVSALPSLNIHTKRLKRKLIGHASDCQLDSISRILIPATLRKYANINKKIMMSGQGNNFEIWDEHTWHEQLAHLDALSKKEHVPDSIHKLAL